jgi:Fe-S oxidoreductase
MWVEATDSGERLAEIRVKEAAAIGADVIATSCPFCLLTLDDAVKVTGYEDRIEVMDIAELIAVAI